jgi:pimeloyl-ACP methyl ester carboxylesterase
MTLLHVREIGEGPRVVLVHGAMLNAARTWSAQEDLAERWRLVLPDRRGFAPRVIRAGVGPRSPAIRQPDKAEVVIRVLEGGDHRPVVVGQVADGQPGDGGMRTDEARVDEARGGG